LRSDNGENKTTTSNIKSKGCERGLTMKKFLAGLLALTMLLSLGAAAFAEAETVTDPGNTTVNGTGNAEYIDLEIYAVTLPTDDSLNFTIDPQGLLDIPDEGSIDIDKLGGGTIVPDAEAIIINDSAVSLKVSVDLNAVLGGEYEEPDAPVFIDYDDSTEKTVTSVNAGTANNVLLYAVPSSADIATAETQYVASANGYIFDVEPIALNFVLGAAKYTVANNDGSYTPSATANTGHGTGIMLGGYVNKFADWSAYVDGYVQGAGPVAKSIGVKAVFTFDKADSEALTAFADNPVEGIPGLTEPDVDMLALTPPEPGFIESAPGISGVSGNAANYTISKGAPDSYTLPFNTAGKDVTKVVLGASNTLNDPNQYTVSGNRVILAHSYVSGWTVGSQPFPIKITVEGNVTYTLTVTIST
jgi:hypothetical protein